MVWPRGRWPLGERGPGCGCEGHSRRMRGAAEEDEDMLAPATLTPPPPPPPAPPPSATVAESLCPPASLPPASRSPWALPSTGVRTRGVSPTPLPEAEAALAKASGKVCSSGEELDLLSVVWEWGNGRSGSCGSVGESVSGGWSMGMAPSLTSSKVDFSSSWLELDDDCRQKYKTKKQRNKLLVAAAFFYY